MVTDVFNDLKRAILEYDNELAISSAKKVIEQRLDPIKALDVMTIAIKQVGTIDIILINISIKYA